MNKKTRIWIHLFYWIFEQGISKILFALPHYKEATKWNFYGSNFFNILFEIALFYVNYYWLVPKYLVRRKYIHYFGFLIPVIFIYSIGIELCWGGYAQGRFILWAELFSDFVGSTTNVLFASTALAFIDFWFKSEKDKIALEKEIEQTELLYLKSQISPHFLFNTLNNIYGLCLTKSTKTATAIGQLKELMMKVDEYGTSSKSSIKSEIQQLQNFIQLNQLRCNVKVSFKIEMENKMENNLFEGMILLPFIENSFKHGNINDDAEIKIELRVQNNALWFSVENEVNANKRIDDVGGIGINNVKRRLELIYRKKYLLDIHKEKVRYKTILNIDLSERSK
jgi:two-component system LytT family sensor kinase